MTDLIPLSRRVFLSLVSALGIASTPALAQTEDETGYGVGGYGTVSYGAAPDATDGPTIGEPISGGGEGDTDSGIGEPIRSDPDPEPELNLIEFTAVETNPKNPHANIRVEWSIEDTGRTLKSLLIRVETVSGDLISRYGESPSGDSSEGSWEHRVHHGGGRTYHISLLVETADGRSETETIQITPS